MRVIVHVDGGARGNPGPAAAAAVVSDPDGQVLDEAAEVLGVATNNVAEYRGLLLGLQRAQQLGATEVDVVNDSELVAKQINGDYKVKHADMKPLHRAAIEVLDGFDRWTVRSVPRAQNAHADALVNQALDARARLMRAAAAQPRAVRRRAVRPRRHALPRRAGAPGSARVRRGVPRRRPARRLRDQQRAARARDDRRAAARHGHRRGGR